MMEEESIELETAEPYTHNWLARTNRLHRTLKEKIKTMFALNGDNIWFPHLASLIDEYNDTPSYAFRNIEALKHPAKTIKGKRYYTPIAPNEVENSGTTFMNKIHDQEKQKAQNIKKYDGARFQVGDYVRLLNNFSKEQIKLNGKFAKKSLQASWTTKVYKIIERTGPNFWRIDKPDGEIKQWASYMLKKTTEEAHAKQTQPVKKQESQIKKVRVSKAVKEMELEIPQAEKAKVIANRTRQTRTSSRLKPESKPQSKPQSKPTIKSDLNPAQKIRFKVGHVKKGKSGERWNIYSKAKTIGELQEMNPKSFTADYKYDLLKGLLLLL